MTVIASSKLKVDLKDKASSTWGTTDFDVGLLRLERVALKGVKRSASFGAALSEHQELQPG